VVGLRASFLIYLPGTLIPPATAAADDDDDGNRY